jgi:RNA polymerase sigma factor (sigma-70 family)
LNRLGGEFLLPGVSAFPKSPQALTLDRSPSVLPQPRLVRLARGAGWGTIEKRAPGAFLRMSDRLPGDMPPHRDPAAWSGLIQEIGTETALVLIASWMSAKLQQQVPAEDIWQEALYMAWRDRQQHEWKGPRRFRAWVLEIARNRVRDAAEWVEAKKRGGGDSAKPFSSLLASQSGSIGGLLPANSTTPSRVAVHGERARAMKLALEKLPERLRLVLWNYLFEERAMTEVAELVGVSLTTAKRLFFEASQKYRAHLELELGTRVEGPMRKR